MKLNPSRPTSKPTYSIYRLVFLLLALVLVFSLVGQAAAQPAAQSGAAPEAPQTVPVTNVFGAEIIPGYPNVQTMADGGAGWVRFNGLKWSDVEPTEGARNWATQATVEAQIADAKGRGMKVILVLRGTPDWAEKYADADENPSCGPIASAKFEAFGLFVKDMATRYAGQVDYYELFNEPDINRTNASNPNHSEYMSCWGDDSFGDYGGGYYAQMLQAAYPKIKEGDANAKVLSGGLLLSCNPAICTSDPSMKFIDGLLSKFAGAPYLDGIGYHAFDYFTWNATFQTYLVRNGNWPSPAGGTLPASTNKATWIKAKMNLYGVTGKELLATEVAVICEQNNTTEWDDCYGPPGYFELTKQYYLPRVYIQGIANGVTADIWYAARAGWKYTDLLWNGPPYDPYLNNSPRPAYYSFKFAESMLRGTQFNQRVFGHTGVEIYEFVKPNGNRLWVVWSLDGLPHTISLPTNVVGGGYYDSDGYDPTYGYGLIPLSNPRKVDVNNEPKYIELEPYNYLRLPVLTRGYALVKNGGFERGLDENNQPVNWLFATDGTVGLPSKLVDIAPSSPFSDSSIPYGMYTARLGEPGYNCFNGVPLGAAVVKQTLTIPQAPNGMPIKLRFKYIVYTQDSSTADIYDRFEVRIDDGFAKTLVFTAGDLGSPSCNKWKRVPESGWAQAEVDLIAPLDYRGKTVTLLFENWNRFDNYYNTVTYLDDITIEVGH